jgi:DNA polymerase-3 subunit delta'
MRFSEIYGNEALKKRLAKMVGEDRLGHAILFVEQEGMGALAFAIALSQYLNCSDRSGTDSCGECSSCRRHAHLSYPDLHFSFPISSSPKLSDNEKKRPICSYFLQDWNALVQQNPYFDSHELFNAIGIENKAGAIPVAEAKEIAGTLSLQPYESQYKIQVIWEPEKMTIDAANKLLKLLEEPPAGTLFILITHQIEKMLSTVISRCQIIRLQPEDRSEMAAILEQKFGLGREEAMDFATLAGGSVGRAFEAVANAGEGSQNEELLCELMDAALARSLKEVLDVAETLASMGKDRQKQWCVAAEGFLRKMFIYSQKLEQIAFMSGEEKEYIQRVAPRIKEAFWDRAVASLDGALRLLDANVSAKLIFADLANRFYLYI